MKYIFSLFLLFFCNKAISQSLSINTDGSTANTSALLDVKSTTKGLLLPRMTKAQKNAITTPATGLLVYQTSPDSVGFHYYNGTTWLWLNPLESNDWKTTGNVGTDTAVNFIGTTDNEPLRFKQSNIRMGQLDINNANYYFGKGAGVKSNSSAFRSVGFGDSSLANATSGDNNTAIGSNALNIITSGSNNTAIGYLSDAGSATLSNTTAIGAFAQADASNSLVLGSINSVNGATANVNVGIGISSPKASLHVRKASSGSIASISNRTLVIEDSTTSYVQLLNPNDEQTGIFSGNTSTLQRSGILFNADSSISLRTGNSSTNRVFVERTGQVGIANSAPEAQLHVSFGGKLPNAKYAGNGTAIFENNGIGSARIQFMNLSTTDFTIFSGTDSTFSRSSITFTPDSAIGFGAGGCCDYDLFVAKNDFVGINTTTPVAHLDDNGTFKLGTNGTINSALIQDVVNVNVGSVPANGELDVIVPLANVATTAAVSVSPSADLPSGIIIAWARVSSSGNIKIRYRNLTGGAIDPAAINYYISAVQ
ncbi:MAG: hypothetical protein IPP96_08455 [Chitinophagaceae bacterium]|nr:hypothetical protein [Chitinophagaceae bacterium]